MTAYIFYARIKDTFSLRGVAQARAACLVHEVWWFNPIRPDSCKLMRQKKMREEVLRNKGANLEFGQRVEGTKVSEWYNRVIKEAGLVDQGPARGTIVLRPYGYSFWKETQKVLGQAIEDNGVQDAYFPAIIPEELLKKEKDHIEGFAPEFLRVHGRGGVIGVLRPTSEAVMYPLFAKWISSYRDLPLKINQWSNVFRDELRTYAFMRTSEFLWQEGHCVYVTQKENEEEVRRFLSMYERYFRDSLAILPVFGKKSEKEKFAGAAYTTTGEALLPGGKALQVCTSHNLGTNFSEAFNITYLGKDGKRHHPYQTSWGLSWRAIGAMLMTHGDKKGLILPPKMAPTQVVVIPIRTGVEDGRVLETSRMIKGNMPNVRMEVDETPGRPGARYNYHELRGVPLRIEVGLRDVNQGNVTVANRLTGEKTIVALGGLAGNISDSLDSLQSALLKRAENLVTESTTKVAYWEQFREAVQGKGGFLATYHCGDRKCEEQIQTETKATLRCIPFNYEASEGTCVRCEKPSAYGQQVLFAKAY